MASLFKTYSRTGQASRVLSSVEDNGETLNGLRSPSRDKDYTVVVNLSPKPRFDACPTCHRDTGFGVRTRSEDTLESIVMAWNLGLRTYASCP
ncbi:hypothetical protein HZH66_001246 [Vespula vulgaris]|uniref:Uncharacterized protein n=1 Tax=Vespula vulgaris TaxID=7454 RepID=A0A834NJD4_VESVU|nr:hypothetical protein HZH66_001246 [Vespula vulgaris]